MNKQELIDRCVGEWLKVGALVRVKANKQVLTVERITEDNGVKSNNSIKNLRAATGSQNQHNRPNYANNTSGFKGVTWNKRRGKWQAQIQVDGVRIHVGCFDCIFDAANAYDKKAIELHKEFVLTNKSMGLLND